MKNEMVCQGDMNLDRLRALLLECRLGVHINVDRIRKETA